MKGGFSLKRGVGGEGPNLQEPLSLRECTREEGLCDPCSPGPPHPPVRKQEEGNLPFTEDFSLCDQVYFRLSSHLTAALGTKRRQC